MASHPLYFVDDLANFHDSCSFSIFCSSRGSVEYICISLFDSPFLKSGIFLQNSYCEISSGRFIIYVEGWGSGGRGEGRGERGGAVW